MFNIYKLTNEITGKVYTGYTSLPIETRWKQHYDIVKKWSKRDWEL